MFASVYSFFFLLFDSFWLLPTTHSPASLTRRFFFLAKLWKKHSLHVVLRTENGNGNGSRMQIAPIRLYACSSVGTICRRFECVMCCFDIVIRPFRFSSITFLESICSVENPLNHHLFVDDDEKTEFLFVFQTNMLDSVNLDFYLNFSRSKVMS